MSQIEIKHLKLIHTIAETENLTRAADRLSISQPALSRQLQDIEDRLGTALFYRSKKRMLLTPEGTRILQTAETVLNELEMVELDISKMVNGESGTLRLGVSCMYCFQWLPGVMAAFQDFYPKVDLTINTCADTSAALKNNIYDMVISAAPIMNEGLTSVDLFKDELVIIVSPENPISTKRFLTPEDISGTKLIISSHMNIDHFSTMLWPGIAVTPEKVMRLDQPNAIVELVKAGFGVSIAPRWAVHSFLSSGRLRAIPMSEKGIYPVWRVVYLKNGGLPAYRQKFIDVMMKQHLP